MTGKVVILANSSSGVYDFRGMLLQRLLEKKEVAVSVPAELKADLLEQMGCRVIHTAIDRRGINPVKDLKLLRSYRKLLGKEKPDLVVTYTIKPNVYGGLACRMKKIPYAANITGLGTAFQNGGLLRKLVVFLYKISLKNAEVVFFENDANRQLFVEEKIVTQDKCCVLSGAGVDLERFTVVPFPASGSGVRFLYIGRVMKEKGVGELFSAMERLRSEGFDCTLDILGYAEDDYEQQLQQGQKAGWLRCHGYQPDVRPYIEQSHCFVLPSYHEGMANTNLECAAMGRPVITTDIPGCREAVVDAKTGILCKPKDTESLYLAMKRFLTMTDAQRTAMGQAGRAHMEQNFDKRKVVQKTLQAIGR